MATALELFNLARAYQVIGTSVNNGLGSVTYLNTTWTQVSFTSVLYDTPSNWNGSNLWTCSIPGKYQCATTITMGISGAVMCMSAIYKNGTQAIAGSTGYSGTGVANPASNASGVLQLAVGDTLAVWAWQDSGGAANVQTANASACTFSIQWLSP